jgi:hypothetical protein
MEKRKMFKRLLKNRKGTAEVIGSVLFIVILLFFFTNVYLWHDATTRDVNSLNIKKLNSGMSISLDGNQVVVKATSSDVKLSRLWIDTSSNHVFVNLESQNVKVASGDTNALVFTFVAGNVATDNSVTFQVQSPTAITVYYNSFDSHVGFTIVNTLGVAVNTQSTH